MNYSKELKEILSTGTPKQKALIICRDRTDKLINSQNPLLTETEVNAIKNSLKGDEDKKEFNKWIKYFNVYVEIAPFLGLLRAEYRMNAHALLVYIRQWEEYKRQATNLNIILDRLIEHKNEEGIKSFYESVKNISLPGASLIVNKDGYISVDIGADTPEDKTKLYGKMVFGRTLTIKFLSDLKAFVVALEEWTEKTRSELFIPPVVMDALEQAKEDYAIHIGAEYSEARLNSRIASGKKITTAERLQSLFPDYNAVQYDKEAHQNYKERIESYARK